MESVAQPKGDMGVDDAEEFGFQAAASIDTALSGLPNIKTQFTTSGQAYGAMAPSWQVDPQAPGNDLSAAFNPDLMQQCDMASDMLQDKNWNGLNSCIKQGDMPALGNNILDLFGEALDQVAPQVQPTYTYDPKLAPPAPGMYA